MSVRFLHIRLIEEDGDSEQNINNKGGITIAFTYTKKDIFLNLAFCHPLEHFCKKTGCKVAADRLKNEGPLDFIALSHPVSEVVRLWFMQYFGVSLVHKDNKIWCTDFVHVEYEENQVSEEEERYPETL